MSQLFLDPSDSIITQHFNKSKRFYRVFLHAGEMTFTGAVGADEDQDFKEYISGKPGIIVLRPYSK